MYWGSSYQILQCRGCEEISFQTVSWSSEDLDPRTGQPEETSHLYPPRVPGVQTMADSLRWLPHCLWRMHTEVAHAIQAQASTLAVIGIRSIVEGICVDQKAEGRDLETKINGLVDLGVLPASHAPLLHILRDYGNRAAHALTTPSAADLTALFELVHQLLITTYRLPYTAKQIQRAKRDVAGP